MLVIFEQYNKFKIRVPGNIREGHDMQIKLLEKLVKIQIRPMLCRLERAKVIHSDLFMIFQLR